MNDNYRSAGLLLIGAGGHGKMVADLAEVLGWTKIAFVDDRWPGQIASGPWPIIGAMRDLSGLKADYPSALASIGTNAVRSDIHNQLKMAGFKVPTLIHPSAVVSRHAQIDAGSVVFAQAVINPFATIGEAVVINTAATVDHDCRLGDGVHVSPGANLSGGVQVGTRTWIGTGSAVREYVTIGQDVVIGVGAAVVGNIEDAAIAVGVPARSR